VASRPGREAVRGGFPPGGLPHPRREPRRAAPRLDTKEPDSAKPTALIRIEDASCLREQS